MNLNINAAASVAGTSRAAAKGGENDAQASESAKRQLTRDSPAGKPNDSSAVDAGDQTGDRGGNGKQMLDVFEHHQDGNKEDISQSKTKPEEDSSPGSNEVEDDDKDAGNHLDLHA